MPPDHIVRMGYVNNKTKAEDIYQFFGEWKGVAANNLIPDGVGVCIINKKQLVIGYFDANGTVLGT